MKQPPAALALLFLSAACSSGTGPEELPSRVYVLSAIGVNPLPAYLTAGAGDTTTVLWATLVLTPDHQAVTTTRLRHSYLAFLPQELTDIQRTQYRMKGDSIILGFFGSCRDLCPVNLVGSVLDSTLTLISDTRPRAGPAYLYHFAGSY